MIERHDTVELSTSEFGGDFGAWATAVREMPSGGFITGLAQTVERQSDDPITYEVAVGSPGCEIVGYRLITQMKNTEITLAEPVGPIQAGDRISLRISADEPASCTAAVITTS